MIKNFKQFFEDVVNDNVETITNTALGIVKKRLEKLFIVNDETSVEVEPNNNTVVDNNPDNQSQNPTEPTTQIQNNQNSQEEIQQSNVKKAKENGREEKENDDNFSSMGLSLDSCELSNYSADSMSLVLKYSDTLNMYSIEIIVYYNNIIKKMNNNKAFTYKDVQDCFVKFKKYDTDKFDLIGEITKNSKLDDINEDYLINLKIELDDAFDDNTEEGFEMEF